MAVTGFHILKHSYVRLALSVAIGYAIPAKCELAQKQEASSEIFVFNHKRKHCKRSEYETNHIRFLTHLCYRTRKPYTRKGATNKQYHKLIASENLNTNIVFLFNIRQCKFALDYCNADISS